MMPMLAIFCTHQMRVAASLASDRADQSPGLGIVGWGMRDADHLIDRFFWSRVPGLPRNDHLYVLARKC